MDGMTRALHNIYQSGANEFPVTIYYAFKQSEVAKEGLTSPGWATFLQGLVDTGYLIDGTWPARTELAGNLKKRKNALASSIVLVCRKRSATAPAIIRREFVARLRSALPDALAKIRAKGVGPVDMAQASIGPGMGVFSANSKVLEPNDTPMTVRTAIALINQVRDENSGEETSGYDADTQFCIDWFEAFGMSCGKAGDAITMAQAFDIGIDGLEAAGVFTANQGTARLLRRDELPADWRPESDATLTHWECAQHLARVLGAHGRWHCSGSAPAGGYGNRATPAQRWDSPTGSTTSAIAKVGPMRPRCGTCSPESGLPSRLRPSVSKQTGARGHWSWTYRAVDERCTPMPMTRHVVRNLVLQPVTGTLFLDEFGFTGQEAIDMHFLARDAARTQKLILSRRILERASHETTIRIARAFRAGWPQGYSKAGQGMIVVLDRDGLVDIDSLAMVAD